MKDSKGLEKFLDKHGNISTQDLLKDRPSDKAVEDLGRGLSQAERTEGEKS